MKKSKDCSNLAILASGNGTNAANFMDYFKNHPYIRITLVISNNPSAYVLTRAASRDIPARVIRNSEWDDKNLVSEVLETYNIGAIVLAGYLKLIPSWLVDMYPNRIFNIHPALLPDYGGKGMYGMHVHKAVVEAGERYSGITIHLVNEAYDKGKILFQKKIELAENETAESLAAKIHELEYLHYPRIVESNLNPKT